MGVVSFRDCCGCREKCVVIVSGIGWNGRLQEIGWRCRAVDGGPLTYKWDGEGVAAVLANTPCRSPAGVLEVRAARGGGLAAGR